jgi:hypothetical protein
MADQIPRRDLQEIADDRTIEQYKRAEKLRAVIALYIAQVTELQAAIHEVIDGFDLDDASGWALDVIGKWVGLPRPLIDAGLFQYFGYGATPGALGYGSLGSPGVGGRYASVFTVTSGLVLMIDSDYRLNIKAKIIRNKTSCRPDDILEIVSLVFGDDAAEVTFTGELAFTLTFGRPLSVNEQALVLTEDLNGRGDQLIPRAAGVSVTYVFP